MRRHGYSLLIFFSPDITVNHRLTIQGISVCRFTNGQQAFYLSGNTKISNPVFAYCYTVADKILKNIFCKKRSPVNGTMQIWRSAFGNKCLLIHHMSCHLSPFFFILFVPLHTVFRDSMYFTAHHVISFTDSIVQCG